MKKYYLLAYLFFTFAGCTQAPIDENQNLVYEDNGVIEPMTRAGQADGQVFYYYG